jgi:hypothetical protein
MRQVALADLHARTIDHFLQPTADPQVAALVQRGKIAGMQPTISINGGRSLWHSKISGADFDSHAQINAVRRESRARPAAALPYSTCCTLFAPTASPISKTAGPSSTPGPSPIMDRRGPPNLYDRTRDELSFGEVA